MCSNFLDYLSTYDTDSSRRSSFRLVRPRDPDLSSRITEAIVSEDVDAELTTTQGKKTVGHSDRGARYAEQGKESFRHSPRPVHREVKSQWKECSPSSVGLSEKLVMA